MNNQNTMQKLTVETLVETFNQIFEDLHRYNTLPKDHIDYLTFEELAFHVKDDTREFFLDLGYTVEQFNKVVNDYSNQMDNESTIEIPSKTVKIKTNPIQEVYKNGTIECTVLPTKEVELIFEVEKKGDFYSHIRVCNYITGDVTIYGINTDGEWDCYDLYSPVLNQMIGSILEVIFEDKQFFFNC